MCAYTGTRARRSHHHPQSRHTSGKQCRRHSLYLQESALRNAHGTQQESVATSKKSHKQSAQLTRFQHIRVRRPDNHRRRVLKLCPRFIVDDVRNTNRTKHIAHLNTSALQCQPAQLTPSESIPPPFHLRSSVDCTWRCATLIVDNLHTSRKFSLSLSVPQRA